MRRYSKQGSSSASGTKNNVASKDNASNRPTKLNALEEAIIKQSKQEVTIRTNGANGPMTETILLGDAVLKRQFKSAIDGSPHAQNQVLKRLQETLSREQTIIQDDIAIGEKFKAIQERALAKAIKNNQDIDFVLPHPDDIIIDDKTGYYIIGPYDQQELDEVKHNCALRDQFILQSALEGRFDWPDRQLENIYDTYMDTSNLDGSAMLFMYLYNQVLPKRFRLSEDELYWAHYQHAKKTKRQLLKETFEGWKLLREPKIRGWITPPIETVIHFVHALAPVLKIARETVKNGVPISDRELAQKLSEALNDMPPICNQQKPRQ